MKMLYVDTINKEMRGTAKAGDIKRLGLFEASRQDGI